jgi:hypothetical protein
VTAVSSRTSLEGQAAEVEGVLLLGLRRGLLGLGDDLLDEGTEGLGLGQRGLDATVLDERGGHVGQHRLAVLAVTPREAWCLL